MTSQALPLGKRPLSMLATAAFATALTLTTVATADAKQACSAAAGKEGYWSWRIIDGRKCWYAGKPMLSKASLEWPAETAAKPSAPAEPDIADAAPPTKRSNPMDAQARDTEGDTFDALWRGRIERPR